MKSSQKYSSLLFLVLWLLACMANAQKSFKYQAEIKGVNKEGFYKINLRPELIAKCKNDLSDLRVMNNKGNFMPFMINPNLHTNEPDFIPFPILSTRSVKDTSTTIVVENKSLGPISSMQLRLKNTAVQRQVDLLGSDDLQKWFAIEERISLQQADNALADNFVQTLAFPVSSYKYFKIVVNDKNKYPINILQAGIYADRFSPEKFIPVPNPKIIRKDSSKVTYITLTFNGDYQIDKLQLDITRPKYFKRSMLIYEAGKQGRKLLGDTELLSNQRSDLFISAKTNQIQLEILNEDNPPLTIERLKAFQANQYVIAYLEPAQTYRFIFGDAKASPPNYDLDAFANNAINNVTEIQHASVSKNTAYQIKSIPQKRDLTTFMWVAIVVVAGLLLLITRRMMKEIKQKEA